MHPANERRRYIVTSSLIGWVHRQNDPANPLKVDYTTKQNKMHVHYVHITWDILYLQCTAIGDYIHSHQATNIYIWSYFDHWPKSVSCLQKPWHDINSHLQKPWQSYFDCWLRSMSCLLKPWHGINSVKKSSFSPPVNIQMISRPQSLKNIFVFCITMTPNFNSHSKI